MAEDNAGPAFTLPVCSDNNVLESAETKIGGSPILQSRSTGFCIVRKCRAISLQTFERLVLFWVFESFSRLHQLYVYIPVIHSISDHETNVRTI